MQTFLTPQNSAIEETALFKFIKQTFSDLEYEGRIYVRRRAHSQDHFFVEFFATANYASYKAGDTYAAPDLKDFDTVDFDDGPDGSCRTRLDHFVDGLKKGTLRPNPKSL